MTLFEVAAIFENEDDEDAEAKVVLEPDTLLAESKESAFMKTIKENPDKFDGYDLDNVEVLVRPFA